MTPIADNPLQAFTWTPQPLAEKLVREIVDDFLTRIPQAAHIARRMKFETGTRFYDWIEAIVLPDSSSLREKIESAGYVSSPDQIFTQPQGMFPRLVLNDAKRTAVHLKVNYVEEFVKAWQLEVPIEGEAFSPYRRVKAFSADGVELWAAERWGWTSFDLPPQDGSRGQLAKQTLESFLSRKRDFEYDVDGFAQAEKLIDASRLGVDFKCALWFEAERHFWQARNHAAQVQKSRQDKLGLGWGNHDHHTYRSSRENFSKLVAVWEKLGLHCRERFYAGKEAGWGAQVMESANAGIITFNDVDLTPKELMGDFSHKGLPSNKKLGTVGLWCGLHGDSFLQAGMHHLEAQFDFDALREQLQQQSVGMMKPFTNFPYLKQAFTEGERWPVNEERLRKLLSDGSITQLQADDFETRGAIGSHLENLQRDEGFKGFNQTGVSQIISETDPRRHSAVNHGVQAGG